MWHNDKNEAGNCSSTDKYTSLLSSENLLRPNIRLNFWHAVTRHLLVWLCRMSLPGRYRYQICFMWDDMFAPSADSLSINTTYSITQGYWKWSTVWSSLCHSDYSTGFVQTEDIISTISSKIIKVFSYVRTSTTFDSGPIYMTVPPDSVKMHKLLQSSYHLR